MNPESVDETKPDEVKPRAGLNALFDEMGIDTTPDISPEGKKETPTESEAEKEKNAKALEKIQPLVDKFNELDRYHYANDEIWSGKGSYYALTNNKEAYTKVHNEDYGNWLSKADVYEEAIKQYHEAGGVGDLKGVFSSTTTREAVLSFEKNAAGGAERQFEGVKEHLKGKRYKKEEDYLWRTSPIASSPQEFIRKLNENAIDVAKYYKGYGGSEQYKRNGVRSWFEKPAIGFGLAALDSGDIEVAAQSFALALAVGEESPELVAQIGQSLKKLDKEKQRKFVGLLEAEKPKIKSQIDSLIM